MHFLKVLLCLLFLQTFAYGGSIILSAYDQYLCAGDHVPLRVEIGVCHAIPIGSNTPDSSIKIVPSKEVMPATLGITICRFSGANCSLAINCENVVTPGVCYVPKYIPDSLVITNLYPLDYLVSSWSWKYSEGTTAYSAANQNTIMSASLIALLFLLF